MLKALCSVCGEEHEFASMEPTYRHPDAFLEVPPNEHELRTFGGKDERAIRTADDAERRYFFRAGMPMPVHGESEPCHWGVWVEVSDEAWERVRELWYESDQASEPPFQARLANALLGYEGTLGLPGTFTLTGPSTVPTFVLEPTLDHPLAIEQRNGVPFERRVEWLAWHAHA
jgi:hypothetical protein